LSSVLSSSFTLFAMLRQRRTEILRSCLPAKRAGSSGGKASACVAPFDHPPQHVFWGRYLYIAAQAQPTVWQRRTLLSSWAPQVTPAGHFYMRRTLGLTRVCAA